MGLSLRDRLKAIKRCIQIIVDPKTEYLNLLWETKEVDTDRSNKILTHTFYQNGADPTHPFMVYMARVAGYSTSIEDLNQRAAYYLNKVAVAYMHFNPSKTHELQYIAQPLIAVEKNTKDSGDEKLEMEVDTTEKTPN